MDKPKLKLVRRGNADAAVVTIPGYLTDKDGMDDRWHETLRDGGFGGSIYTLWWDSSNNQGAAKHNVLIRWHWSKIKKRAKRTGRDHLADALARQVSESHVTLLAHSLGARVAYYALAEGGTRADRLVMFGGAIRRDSRKDWRKVAKRLRGGIYNVRNEKDQRLQGFKLAEPKQNPVGLKAIKARDVIH